MLHYLSSLLCIYDLDSQFTLYTALKVISIHELKTGNKRMEYNPGCVGEKCYLTNATGLLCKYGISLCYCYLWNELLVAIYLSTEKCYATAILSSTYEMTEKETNERERESTGWRQ